MNDNPLANSPIRAIMLDFGGTIFDYSPQVISVWQEHLCTMGDRAWDMRDFNLGLARARIWLDEETIRRRCSGRRPELSFACWDQFYRIVLEEICGPALCYERTIRDRRSALAAVVGRYTAKQGVHDILTELKTSYSLGLVSNTSVDIRPSLYHAGLLHLFDSIVLSFEVDLWKPEPEIFELACGSLGLGPHEVLYVGDSPVCDVEGARKAGIRCVLLDELGLYESLGLRINSLSQLPTLIAELL